MPMYQWNHIEGSPMPVFFYRILQYTYHHNTNIPISTFTTTSSYDNITIRYGYLRGPLNPNPSPVVTRRGGSLCGIDFGFGEPRDWGRCLQVRGWVGVHAWERSAYSLPKRGGIYQSIQKDRSCAFPLTVSSACSPIHQSIHLTHAPPQQSHIYIHLHTSTYLYSHTTHTLTGGQHVMGLVRVCRWRFTWPCTHGYRRVLATCITAWTARSGRLFTGTYRIYRMK